jgi:hypothetical protein
MSLPVLPEVFCWTRFGPEAGEGIGGIMARKERERRANGGLFTWGVGNSVAPGITELLRHPGIPEVLFSPIRARPRRIDLAPNLVVRWRAATTLAGRRITLQDTFTVTSGVHSLESAGAHYALVCSTEAPLTHSDGGQLRFSELRNLQSGKPLGPSQVTAVVRRLSDQAAPSGSVYVVALRARLTDPYFLRLEEPEPIDQDHLQAEAA